MNHRDGSCLAEPAVCVCDGPGWMAQRRCALLLPLAAAFLLFWGLGACSLWAAEGRWAQVTREMFLTGDFFHPTIGGEPYFDKPLLTYWLRAVIFRLTGVLNELTTRLPSAFAGVVAVWATTKIGRTLWSARTGRIAGWLLLTTYAFLFWARTGTADAENLAVIVLAVAWYWSRRDKPGFTAMLVFYLIAFVGALTKGLTAVVVPIVVVLPDMVVERRWRILFSVKHIGAFGLGLLVYLSPFVYASMTQPGTYGSSGLALVFQENILRYFQPIDHKGPIYLYVYHLPILLLPWTPLFVLAAIGVAKCRKSLDRHTRWLIWAIMLVFLFFSLSGSRRSYYILPILPFCALLMAVFVVSMSGPLVDALRERGLAIQRTLFTGLVVFDLAIPPILTVAGRVLHFHAPLTFYIVSIAIGIAAAVVGIGLDRLGKRLSSHPGQRWAIQPLIGVAVVLLGGYFCWQRNILETNRTERQFASELRAKSTAFSPERIAMFPKTNANMLFYLGADRPILTVADSDQFQRFLEPGLPGVVITQNRYVAGIPEAIQRALWSGRYLKEQVQPWESESTKKEKWVAWFWERSAKEPNDIAGAGEDVDHAE